MTISPNIYKIDKKNIKIKDCETVKSLIQKIIRLSYEKSGKKSVPNDLTLTSFKKDKFTYYLYLYNTRERESEWANFLPEELSDSDKFIQQKLSLILFIETEFELFAIVGGNSFRLIIPFIDHSFGLNTYDRIIDIAEDELSSMKTRGIAGQRLAANEQYRENYRLINYIKFGKVPQEIHVKLTERNSKLYFPSLIDSNTVRLNIAVGKGFRIKKAVDFEQLHVLIDELCTVRTLVPSDYLSSYIEIQDVDKIHELYEILHSKIYNHIAYLNGSDPSSWNSFECDFCNPNNVERFYAAEKYVLKSKEEEGHVTFATVFNRQEIYKITVMRAYELFGNDSFKIKVFLSGVRVFAHGGSRNPVSSSFIYHISCELIANGRSIFLIDTKWYYLKELFVEDLKKQTERIFKVFKANANILPLPWDKNIITKESEYNLQFDLLPNYIVLDAVIVDGIELCDILFYNESVLYLIHVKYGFDSKVRELTNQMLISARRLSEAKGSGNQKFFSKIYNGAIKRERNLNGLSEDEFINLFSKDIVYLFAITSHLKKDLIIEDNIESYSSNIARFSLTNCSTELRNFFEMETYQVPRTT